jgi:hypothetical protein
MMKDGVFWVINTHATDSTYGCVGKNAEVIVVTAANDDQYRGAIETAATAGHSSAHQIY